MATVRVKAHTRPDGTRVKAHTRQVRGGGKRQPRRYGPAQATAKQIAGGAIKGAGVGLAVSFVPALLPLIPLAVKGGAIVTAAGAKYTAGAAMRAAGPVAHRGLNSRAARRFVRGSTLSRAGQRFSRAGQQARRGADITTTRAPNLRLGSGLPGSSRPRRRGRRRR